MKTQNLDFSKYRFRCSSLGYIMQGVKPVLTAKQTEYLQSMTDRHNNPEAKPLTEKQLMDYGQLLAKKKAGPQLSQTAKSYLEKIHKEEVFGRRKELQNKYLDKGIQVEEAAITLYSEVTGQLFIKNKERKENAYITGECDNAQGRIRDIKSSWDFTTFPLHATELPDPVYFWQMQGYMQLYKLPVAEVIYCLVDTPELLINDELRRLSWKLGYIGDIPEELEQETRENMIYSDIAPELRIKTFEIKQDPAAIESLYSQIDICRDYLNSLTVALAEQPKVTA